MEGGDEDATNEYDASMPAFGRFEASLLPIGTAELVRGFYRRHYETTDGGERSSEARSGKEWFELCSALPASLDRAGSCISAVYLHHIQQLTKGVLSQRLIIMEGTTMESSTAGVIGIIIASVITAP
jgi:hypothetical protein